MAVESVNITADTAFPQAAVLTARRLSSQMLDNITGTKRGEDIEALHDMRVASRRLRSALRVFRRCFSPESFAPVDGEARSVTQALGQVRDQDVFIEFLREWAEANADIDILWLVDREEKIRDGARLHLLDEMDRLEEVDLPAMIDRLAAVDTDGRKNRFYAHAAPLLQKRLDDVKCLSKALDNPEDIAGHHLMRIGAKRLRYTMEIFVPAFGQPLEDEIANLKTLQDQLGLMHDCDVWSDKLRLYREEPGLSPDRLAALDRLVDDRASRRQEAYRDATGHWRNLSKTGFPKRLIKLVSGKPETAKSKGVTKVEDQVKQEPAKSAESTQKPQAKRTSTRKSPAKPAAAPPKPPTPAEEARTSLAQASTRLSTAETLSPKLAKQFGKLEAAMEKLPADGTNAGTEKRLGKLKDVLGAVPEDGAMSRKKAENLRQSVRDIRKKLEATQPKAEKK